MAVQIARGQSDAILAEFIKALEVYEADHPGARIDLYRQNPVSVRVRIIDPRFRKRNRSNRHDDVWKYLDAVSDEAVADLSSLILLAPEETATSAANMIFEDPEPSLR